MKRIHFKYSALTLALMANFAIPNFSYANTDLEDVGIQTSYNERYYELKNKHITGDQRGLYSLYIEHKTGTNSAVLKNVSITHSEKQSGVLNVNNSIINIDGLKVNSTNPASLYGLYFDTAIVTIKNATVDLTTQSAKEGSPLYGALKFWNVPRNYPVTMNNSSITNHGNKSAVVILESAEAAFDNVLLNATGKDSTLFSVRDHSTLTANNLTAKNTGNNGSFLTVETVKGQGGIYDHNFTLTNSTISAKQGIDWRTTNGTIGIFLENTTLAIEDQLVHVNADKAERITTVFDLGANSTLTGGFKEPKSYVDITLKSGSKWNLTSDSIVNSLSSVGGNSDIYFEHAGDKFKTLRIENSYEGDHRFHLNSNLSNNQSDKVEILGNFGNATSSATLNITDKSGDEMFTDPEGHKVTVLTAANTPTNFNVTLANNNQYVNAGGYRYRLTQETTKDSWNWLLTNQKTKDGTPEVDPDFKKKEDPKEQPKDNPQSDQPRVEPKPKEEPKTEPKADPKGDGLVPYKDDQKKVPHEDFKLPEKDNNQQQDNNKPQTKPNNGSTAKPELELNDTANNLTSLRAAQVTILDAELAGVHQRLGDVRNGKSTSVWTRSVNQTQKFDEQSVSSQSKTSGGTLDTYNLQLGADTGVTDNVRLGGFVSATAAKMDFDGSYSDAKLYSKAVALYASYLNDNGFYVDGIAKYSRLRSEFNTGGTSKKDVTYHYNAYTVSTEVGREFNFANQWSVTPQVQLGWSTISGNKYEDRLNVLHSKAGVRLAKGIQTSSLNLKPFAEVNGVYDKFNHNQVTLGKQGFDVARLGGRVETAVGLGLSGGNHSFSIQANNAYGKHIKKYWSAQATYRYQW
ncbi:autotransporter outer membrane beta-barrel domain-containing protein [Lonepinella sp. MS14435]|uniref:autotransporter outer membrane beta-barrel domain-containing protein n=1 Tax=Lonepinella sp. MS14435 TaxID=3003618 RepID=UPI0036DCC239